MGSYYDTSDDNPRHPDPRKVEEGLYPLIIRRNETTINFNDHPTNNWPVDPPDRFAARYNVTIEVYRTGTYTLQFISDYGIIVELDGREVLNDWSLHGARDYSVDVGLNRGGSTDLLFYTTKTRVLQSCLSI